MYSSPLHMFNPNVFCSLFLEERQLGAAPRGHVGPRGDRADAAARRLAHRRPKQGTRAN